MTIVRESALAIVKGYNRLPYEGRAILYTLPFGFGFITMEETNGIKVHVDIPGTKNWNDIIHDAEVEGVDFKTGKVFEGPLNQLNQFKDSVLHVLENLPDEADVTFSGHSEGAVIAVLLATMFKPSRLHLFACPNVGNQTFIDYFKSLNINTSHYAEARDKVPRFPLGLKQVCEPTYLYFKEVNDFDELGQHSILNIANHIDK